MKVLFDANVPAKLRNHLPGHEVTRAQTLEWQELQNGALLDAAEKAGFNVMVTGDKNLSYQQNLAGRKLALVVLPTIDWRILRQDTASVLTAVDRATPGSFEALSSQPRPRLQAEQSSTMTHCHLIGGIQSVLSTHLCFWGPS